MRYGRGGQIRGRLPAPLLPVPEGGAYGGAPAVNITVPTRYLHNHNGVIHRDDFDQAVELVTELVRRLDQATVERIKRFD